MALAAFVGSALLTLLILWPFDFRFGFSARRMLRGLETHEAEAGEFYRALALQLEWRYDQNRRKIRRLQWSFELAIVCLVLEVAAWIAILWRA
jgi:hypothetical protein